MSEHSVPDKTYWKSFEELANDPAVVEELNADSPDDAEAPPGFGSSMARRTFMGMMAASIALAATSCRRPEQEIVPYVKKPEDLIPGIPKHYATAFSLGNFSYGLLVKSREGRPIKIEGNDLDPIAKGSSSAVAQASLLSLYDPDRILRPTVNNSDSTPQNAVNRIVAAVKEVGGKGKKVRVLVDEHSSPVLAALFQDVERVLPNTKIVTWPAFTQYGAAEANAALLGVDGVIVADLSKADVILGIDADFLGADPEAIYHAKRFSAKRKPSLASPKMSRYYAVEPSMTLSGSNADHRIKIRPDEIDDFLLSLLHEIVVERKRSSLAGDSGITNALAGQANGKFVFIKRIADDLLNNPSVVMAGKHLPYHTQALCVILNQAIGAYGTGKPLDPALMLPFSNAKTAQIRAFEEELKRGEVGAVIFAGVNPVYAMPGGRFEKLMSKVLYRFQLSLYADETSKKCSIFIPVNHQLECWGEVEMLDGTRAIAQPLIAPLNEAQLSMPDVLLSVMKGVDPKYAADVKTYYDYIRQRWEQDVYAKAGGPSFSAFWEDALRKGVIVMPPASRATGWNSGPAAQAVKTAANGKRTSGMICGVLPHVHLYDGRFANTGWLQELPDPITKIAWDNAALMNKKTAEKLGVKKDDVVKVTSKTGTLELPVYVQPGMADEVVVLHTGYGRSEGGRVLAGVGVNTFELLPAGSNGAGYFSVSVQPTGEIRKLACTQEHHTLNDKEMRGNDRTNLFKEAPLAAFLKDPNVLYQDDLPVYGAERNTDRPISLVEPHDYSKGHRWAMTVDSSACVGCNACVVACVSENNIPMVGKEQVANGREMMWLRIDNYFTGEEENPDTLRMPILCQHCENAPCEVVCPVAATTHSNEGLNEMTYNRCVGTRYCSNNCPYKVRRFNFLDWHKNEREPQSLVFSPDVTVRMRGVMEKCTFCVQRINEAKYGAKNEGRDRLGDGEVVTACQQACPADAIVFGDANDPESAVSKSKKSDRGYHLLRELNTRPSITYLAKIRNTTGERA